MNRLELDDTDSQIGYVGAWILLKGSSRQWQSTTHTTTETGASASVNFQGTRVVVYITVPIGSGTGVHATVTLDGAQTAISHQTNTTAIYNVILFDSGPISDTPHTISLTNAGSALDSPLQFDRFHLEGENFNVSPGIVPTSIAPSANTSPGSTSTVSSTSGNSQLPGTLRPIFSGNSLDPLIAPTAAIFTALQSTSASTAIGETDEPQNFAVPESAKGITTGRCFEINMYPVINSCVSLTFSDKSFGLPYRVNFSHFHHNYRGERDGGH
uniref:Uncharacterized protein n=1 Tax=Psilocybe cubensis TaxID=181762 RepID=A0A8H7XIW9_PSICU